MIRNLAHVCIAATDLAATEEFYCSVLGINKVFDFIRGGETVGFYLRVLEDCFIEVFRQDKAHVQDDCLIKHLCFEVDDIDAVIRQIRSRGHEVTNKALGADQSWQAWTADPSGVRIEFHQYTAESCQRTARDCVLD